MRLLILGIIWLSFLTCYGCMASIPYVNCKGVIFINWDKKKYPKENIDRSLLDMCIQDYGIHYAKKLYFWEAYENDHNIFLVYEIEDWLDTFVVYVIGKGEGNIVGKIIVGPGGR